MKKHDLARCTILPIAILLFCVTGRVFPMTPDPEGAPLAKGEHTAKINGLILSYTVAGSGPVCIHPTPGWGPSSELYSLSLKPLEQKFTMVYLDTRGCGRSEKPALNALAMKDLVQDLEGLRKHLGVDSVWLMGHSDGGLIILNYAFSYAGHVRGLIVVDAPLGGGDQSGERFKKLQLRKNEPWFPEAFKAFQAEPKSQEEFTASMHTIMPFFFWSIENLKKNQEVFDKTDVSFYARRGRGSSDQSTADLASFYPVMTIPTLIIMGSDDFVCSQSACEAIQKEIRHSQLLVIKNAGHFPWMEQQEEFFGGINKFVMPYLQ